MQFEEAGRLRDEIGMLESLDDRGELEDRLLKALAFSRFCGIDSIRVRRRR